MQLQETVHLNGTLCHYQNAHISVMDRGFLFGDGVYETIGIFNHQLAHVQAHLERLQSSLDHASITNPYDHKQWHEHMHALIAQNPALAEGYLYIQITRGTSFERHHGATPSTPTVLMFLQAKQEVPLATQGLRLMTQEDLRWGRCDIKSTSLMANVLHYQAAKNAQKDETLLLRNGILTEGSTCNVFIVQNHCLRTPKNDQHILNGILRNKVLELASELDIPVNMEPISYQDLLACEECFITSSSRNLAWVCEIDDHLIHQGTMGPLFQKLHHAFHSKHQGA